MSAPVPGNNPKILSTTKPKDLRSRRCSRCDSPALYVFGARGYCAAHVREVKGFRPGEPTAHELELQRELFELRRWIPLET